MDEMKTFYRVEDTHEHGNGLGGTGVGLGAGALGVGVAALASMLGNKAKATDAAVAAIPAAVAAIPSMINANGVNSVYCPAATVTRDTFDLYREGCDNTKENIRQFASLADRINNQFFEQANLVWQDRLTQQAQISNLESVVKEGIAKQECCCAMLNQRMDYEAQIADLKNQIGFNSILCRMPQTSPIQVYPPLPYVYNTCGTTCGTCAN